eukprot:scaffold87390_cov33-Prasinocladus_malaysianus.AAC.1
MRENDNAKQSRARNNGAGDIYDTYRIVQHCAMIAQHAAQPRPLPHQVHPGLSSRLRNRHAILHAILAGRLYALPRLRQRFGEVHQSRRGPLRGVQTGLGVGEGLHPLRPEHLREPP